MSNERLLSLSKHWLPPAFGVTMLVAAIVSRFAVLSNDSFPLLWQARHLSLADPATLYNGFFPIGYPLLMRLAALSQGPLTTLEIVQVVLAPIYIALAYRLFARFLRPQAVLLGILALIAYPDFLRSVLSATPDFFASIATLAGLYLMIKERYGYAGVAFGCGLMFRTHILGLLMAILVTILLLHRNGKFGIAGRVFFGALPFILLQGIVHLWSGHRFFENTQAFNVYRTMYGINWNTPAMVTASTVELVAHDPLVFARAYFVNLANGAIVLLPVAILLILNSKRRYELTIVTICFGSLLYVLTITAVFSPRALLPVWPCAVLAGMVVLQNFDGLLRPRLLVAAEGVVALLIVGAVFVASFGSRERVNEYEEIGEILHLNSLDKPHSIYTDDFALYFPQLYDATPRVTGSWALIGLPEYSKQSLYLDWRNAEAFRQSLKNAEIQTVIFREPPINPDASALATADTGHFKLILKTRTHNAYRVE